MKGRYLTVDRRKHSLIRSDELHQLDLFTMHEMEEEIPMTLKERGRLRKWVYTGHDPETNPWGYEDAYGGPMNYIEAYRLYREDHYGSMYAPSYLVVKNPAVFGYLTAPSDHDGCFNEEFRDNAGLHLRGTCGTSLRRRIKDGEISDLYE